MEVLLSWLKEFINLDSLSIDDICDTLTRIGLEVEDVKQIGCGEEYFKDLVVGEVIECTKHPNADRLNCTKVDIGSGVILDIVCGAPNVKVGLKVVVAKVGATLRTYSGEKFKIKKSKIRGEISDGMLCADDEIGISNNHECIIELDAKYNVGQSCYEIYKDKFEKDYLISISLTPNLSYASSYLGIAKDLSAALNIKTNIHFAKQDIKKLDKNTLIVDIDDNNLCNRFSCILVKNVKIKESSKVVKDRLLNSGIKPINNIVDLSNYVMLELGTPLHVYDFNKIDKNMKITTASDKEFLALNNKKYTIKNDIVVSDCKDILVLGGVIGGLSSFVSDNTTDILIECASYSRAHIRATSKRLNLSTEASYRAERGVDENNILNVLNKYLEYLIAQEPNVEIYGYVDINNCNLSQKKIETSFTNINKIIGQNIEESTIIDILNRLEIITEVDDDKITAIIPSYRKNIECENDIVHEILRFYGYNNLNYSEYENKTINIARSNKVIDIKNTFCNILCSNGFYEIRTNPLISKQNVINAENIVELKNPSSSFLNALRNNLIYNGLEVIEYNINHSNKVLNLFEFGKTYRRHHDDFIEQEHLAIYISGHEARDNENKYLSNGFFELKKYVLKLLHSYNLNDFKLEEPQLDIAKIISGRSISYKNETIGYLGNVSSRLLNIYGINQDVFFADLYFYKILELIVNCPPTTYKEISKYQIIKRDLSIILDENINFENVKNTIIGSSKKITSVRLIDIYIDKNNTQKKTYSISFYIDPGDDNMSNNEILSILNNVIDKCEKDLRAVIRKE